MEDLNQKIDQLKKYRREDVVIENKQKQLKNDFDLKMLEFQNNFKSQILEKNNS